MGNGADQKTSSPNAPTLGLAGVKPWHGKRFALQSESCFFSAERILLFPRAVAIAARGAGSGARRRQRRAHNVARCVCGLGLGGAGGDAPCVTQQARLDGAAGREPRAAISQSSALDATSAAWSNCNMGTGARAAWHWRAPGGGGRTRRARHKGAPHQFAAAAR